MNSAEKKTLKMLVQKIKKQRKELRIKDSDDIKDHFMSCWHHAKNLFPENQQTEVMALVEKLCNKE